MNENSNLSEIDKGPSEPASRPGRIAIGWIVVTGVLISLWVYQALWRQQQKLMREEFNRYSADRMVSISREFDSGMALVRSVSAFVQAADVEADGFRNFTSHLFSPDSTVQALSFNTRVAADQVRAHVDAIRVSHSDYVLREMDADGNVVEIDIDDPMAQPRDFVLVDFIEPFDKNQSAVGFDIASEPVRREALERTRDSGELAATGAIRLVQETEHQYGVLVFAPIYQRGEKVETVAQRREKFAGVVVGVYRIGETVEAALRHLQAAGVDVFVFDKESSNDDRLLHYHPSRLRTGSTSPSDTLPQLRQGKFFVEESLDIGGRQWTLCFTPTEQFVQGRITWLPFGALVAGLLITGLLSRYVSNLTRLTEQLRHHLARRERAEQALQRTQHSIECSQIPVYWIGVDGSIQYGNEVAGENLGYSKQELLTMSIFDIAPSWSPDQWPTRWRQWKHSGSAVVESVLQRRDGSQFPVEIMANYFAYGDCEYLYCQALDVTERRDQQQRIREHEKALAHVSRLSTLGEMVAGIAHEIHQPLSAISMYAGACSRGLDSTERDRKLPLEEWLQQIGDQAVRCGDIIRRLRGFVKKSDSQREPVDLREVVEESIALIQNSIKDKSIGITIDDRSEQLEVQADRVQLQQVVVNLLCNACEAVGDCPPERRHVTVYSATTEQSVRVTVEDRGHGITEANLGRLFEAFFTTKDKGMGLGLAISRSIVESHEGHLWAENTRGGGARFHLELPLGMAVTHGDSESPMHDAIGRN